MPRNKTVRKIESMPGSWALKSYILHRAGYSNKGGHWKKARGASLTRVRRQGGIRTGRKKGR